MDNADIILEKISDVHREVIAHILEEKPVLELIKSMSKELGTEEQVRARRIFIEQWMEREKDRADLRKAIIKHGTIIALAAIAIFFLKSAWIVIVDVIHGTAIR